MARSLGALLVAAATLLATAAPALPPSLRTESDVRDAIDRVMRAASAGRLAVGLRGLGPYTTMRPEELARQTVELEKAETGRRKRLGLAGTDEEIESAHVGERLWRITRLRHYDRGWVAWRFVFHRADRAWELVSLEVVENDPSLFGALPTASDPAPAASERQGEAGEGR